MPTDPVWNAVAQLAIGAAAVSVVLVIALLFINPRDGGE